MKLTKRLVSLALALIFCLGLFVTVQGEEAEFGAATSLQTGEYILVVSGITPTGMSRGDYYITDEEANNPGLLFDAFDKNDPDSATYWKVARVSDTECTIQNEDLGENGYLNMSANTLKYGKKQNLKYQFSAGQCKFYVTVGATNYYIRFTNSTNNESRFHAGTGDGSNLFKLYGMITPEPEPDLPTSTDADLPLPKGDPLLTVACVSDMHADYGLQSDQPYIRNSVIETLNRISMEENADILLVGGDNTSDNAKMSEQGGWSYETYRNVIEAYREIAGDATESGRSLWAAGNHDYQAGEDDNYDAYAGYESIMTEGCGDPVSVYRQKDDKSLSDQRYPEYIMGLHYKIEGFDFLVVNPPYSKALTYSTGTYQWLSDRLASIGDTRTVFLLTHYPFTDGRGISTPTYGLTGGAYTAMTGILKKYPNVIYLYGHNHGGAESVYISEDTFERITSYSKDGRVVNDRYAIPESFITSFMGSMSYYDYSLNPGGLGAADPEIVQALMIYVYGDRIVFQMKNYGENNLHSDRQLKSWTVMRDVEGSLDDPAPEISAPGTDGSDTGDPGDAGNIGDKQQYTPETNGKILVTEDVNPSVNYDPALSIRNYSFEGDVTELKSYGHTALAGTGLSDDMKLTLKTITSGSNYSILSFGIRAAVNEFSAYELIVKQDGSAIYPEGAVKVTISVPDELADKLGDLDFGAYYVKDTALHMTDVELSEDGKSLSFILPELRAFALSARATVAYDLEHPASGASNMDLILAVAGGVIALGGLIALAVVLVRMWKKDRATPYQS